MGLGVLFEQQFNGWVVERLREGVGESFENGSALLKGELDVFFDVRRQVGADSDGREVERFSVDARSFVDFPPLTEDLLSQVTQEGLVLARNVMVKVDAEVSDRRDTQQGSAAGRQTSSGADEGGDAMDFIVRQDLQITLLLKGDDTASAVYKVGGDGVDVSQHFTSGKIDVGVGVKTY